MNASAQGASAQETSDRSMNVATEEISTRASNGQDRDAAIFLRGVKKSFGRQTVLNGIDLQVFAEK